MSSMPRLVALLGAGLAAYRLVQRRRQRPADQAPVHVDAAVTVDRPPEAVYGFWGDPENLAGTVGRFAAVETLSEDRARWTLRAPAGPQLSFEAVVTEARPPELLRFRSGARAPIPFEGEVRFTDVGGGRTALRVSGDARPPGGAVGAAAAGLLGGLPNRAFEAGLQRLKERLEAEPPQA